MVESLFERLVHESGLAPLIAAPSLRRALTRSGLDADQLRPADLPKAMSAIEVTLRVYLSEATVLERLERIRRLR